MVPLSSDELRANIAQGRRRAQHAVVALYVAVAAVAVQAVAQAIHGAWLGRMSTLDGPEASQSVRGLGQLAVVGAVTSFAALVVGAVFFGRWLHLAYRNAAAMQEAPLRYSAGEAVGSFFLPFVNLVRPYQAMADLQSASDPGTLPVAAEADDGAHYRENALRRGAGEAFARAPLGAWWAFWLLSSFAGYGGTYFDPHPTILQLVRFDRAQVTADVLRLIAGLLAVACVRALDARLVERARRYLATLAV